jgi:hypothetical protein
MNWMPIKHTLFVNRSRAGTFSLHLKPNNFKDRGGFTATADGPTFEEALSHIENKVKAVRILREGA